MKTASEDLFQLIKSLTRHEKAYFKRYSNLYNDKEQHYVALFELINQQEKYDETALKKQLVNYKLKDYLPRAKKYLYTKILESMRNYHANRNCLQSLRQEVQEIDFLIKKDLLQQAQKKLKKAYKIATKAKLSTILFDLWRMQFLLWFKGNYNGVKTEELEGVQKEMANWLLEENSALQHRFLQASIRIIILHKGDYSKWAVQELWTNYQEKINANPPIGAEAQFYHDFGQAHYFRINQALQDSLPNYIKATQALENLPELKSNLFDFYLTGITHLVGVAVNCFDVETAEKGLAELQLILNKEKKQLSKKEQIKYHGYYHFLKLKCHYDFALYAVEKIDFIEKTQLALKADWEQIDLQVRLVILLCFVYLSFAKGDYIEMQDWCNVLLDLAEKHFRIDIQNEVGTWLIVAYYELGKEELALHQIRHIIRQNQTDGGIQQIIYTTVKKCINNGSQPTYWEQMITALEAFATEQNSYPPIIIYTYALAKYKNKPFAVIHRQTMEEKRAFLLDTRSLRF